MKDAWIGFQAAQFYGESQNNRKFWKFGRSFKHLKTGVMGKLVLPAANLPGMLGIDSRGVGNIGVGFEAEVFPGMEI